MIPFVILAAFLCGLLVGAAVAFNYGYKQGAENKRQTLVKGMDALLESEDLKIYVKKGSSFLTDGPR